MKLYYVPKTRAFRVRWLLEEANEPYELVQLDPKNGDTRRPEYLAIHPKGHVPALVDGDLTMFESAAILQQLADRWPEKGLAPAIGSNARAAYYQWICFGISELEPHLAVAHVQLGKPEGQRDASVLEDAKARFSRAAAVLEAHLQGRAFVAAGWFTAADVLVSSLLAWARMMGMLQTFPGLEAYQKRLYARPANVRARAD